MEEKTVTLAHLLKYGSAIIATTVVVASPVMKFATLRKKTHKFCS